MSAIWVTREEEEFVEFLSDHVSEAGDGGSFKTPTFAAAAAHIAPFLERGPVKTTQMCKNKYGAMRKAWKVVCAIKQVSGWSWDETTGASINPDTASSWDDYVARHPDARPFRNRGWPHARAFEVINPSPVSGANVFVPTASPPPASSSTPSPTPLPTQDNTQGNDEDNTAEVAAQDSQEEAEGLDDDWVISQPVVPTGSKRRAPASASPPVSKRAKAVHPAAAALSGLSTSMDNFANAIVTAIATPPPSSTPESTRLSVAIQTAMQLEVSWLTTADLGALVDLLCEKQAYVDSYLALEKNEDVRREWVSKRLHIL